MKFDLSKKQHWLLLVIFFIISFLISKILSELITIKNVFLEIPGFFGVFSFLLWVFDNHIWKWKIFRFFKIIEFPDLSGEYKGSFESSYKKDRKNVTGSAKLVIKQTASNITIQGVFNESQSISVHSFFAFNDLEQKNCLYYFYKNKPAVNAVETMNQHEGVAILCFDENTKILNGEYYSSRDRNNYGVIEVKLINQKN